MSETNSRNGQHRTGGYYGRPRWKLQYYSERINALAFKSFKTRHAAIGEMAKLSRRGVGKRFSLEYEESYR